MSKKPILLFWQAFAYKGWGHYARDLIIGAKNDGRALIYSAFPLDDITMASHRENYDLSQQQSQKIYNFISQKHENDTKQPTHFHARDHIVCYSYFNSYKNAIVKQPILDVNRFPYGDDNVNIGFYEDGYMSSDNTTAHLHVKQIAGSSWNKALLQSQGFENTYTHIQGVDSNIFYPSPTKTALFDDKFIIFSGGVLGTRKSFDIVTKAFAIFAKKYKDTFLICNWPTAPLQQSWQEMLPVLEHQNLYSIANGMDFDYHRWLHQYGISQDQYLLLPQLTAQQCAQMMRYSHVGLFPNRCEGGTNRVAMEAMACGLPVIISDNTGHQDIIDDDMRLALRDQRPIDFSPLNIVDSSMWRESNIDEIIANLEYAYHHRDEIKKEGHRNSEKMKQYDIIQQSTEFIDIILK